MKRKTKLVRMAALMLLVCLLLPASALAYDANIAGAWLTQFAQALTANNANPKNLERAMETARGAFWLTGVNAAGHRHILPSKSA